LFVGLPLASGQVLFELPLASARGLMIAIKIRALAQHFSLFQFDPSILG
jgi:hypothetical protein